MQIFRRKKQLRAALDLNPPEPTSVGLVPTMGALHLGHLALVQKAIAENSQVVVSIFVNPTQFNNSEDFVKYPSDLDRDIALLSSISENIIVFAPSKDEIYDSEVQSKSFNFDGLDKVMEGEFRPGHFNGVATVVKLLFEAIKPTKAYFGEKDFQQLLIIKKLVSQFKIDVDIISCPIEREPNGLARSSRNERLSKPTKKAASFIYKTLEDSKMKIGIGSIQNIKNWVSHRFRKNSLFELEYFEITDIETLTPVNTLEKDKKYRAFIAVYTEGVRLIDNIAIN